MTESSSIDTSVTNIWRAWRAFRRGKRRSRAIDAFEANLEEELLWLAHDINTNMYQHGDYSHKIVNEKKRRDIYVASVRDRVVHRLLYDYLLPIVDPRLDHDVWSCRQGKGLHGALARTQQLARRYSGGWVYRADVRKFFDTVDQTVLRRCLVRLVTDEWALYLIDQVLASYNTPGSHVGMPIGNLTSQLFANVYLNEFDRYVRHSIRPPGYLRYGDDFVLFGKDEPQAAMMAWACREFLERQLLLELHPTNNATVRVSAGIRFLGHYIYPHSYTVSRRQARLIRRRVSPHNVASYQRQALSRHLRRRLPWILLEDSRASTDLIARIDK